ncbi:WbqC family protein [Aliiroseovarius sp. S1339]|uniref:WbqC family protein n=1 Tax=Aliiroseovarius sp. S1339 TaxID=2936990 RepID=UPI0020BF9C3E|nr:WbqC family protein [Aliiroseovarius sp. S1339]MCK8464475.1 WbqC family protein [Aliiroseovarius sp. S1339]
MQPYLFPYLGYFQLISAADEFWLLDDVQFIQQGWMHRNRLLVGGQEFLFTIPVNKHPRMDLICNKTFGHAAVLALEKLRKTIVSSYAKAPYVSLATDLVAAVAEHITDADKPADFTDTTCFALERTCAALGINTVIRRTSDLSLDPDLTGQARIIAACRAIGAESYVNMIGGKALYDGESFAKADISLWFLNPTLPEYPQGIAGFVPGLSILDAIAHVSADEISTMLTAAELIRA